MAQEITSNSSSVKFELASQNSTTPHSPSGGSSASGAPNEQTVISKGAPFAPPPEAFAPTSQSDIGKSLEGQQLGQFRLEEFVGGGGMGAVIRGVDTTLDRVVAIKVVSNERTDEDTLRRFRNEAQSAARLDHPNIARVYSVGEEGAWSFIVFEFIEGVNIRDLVIHKGPLPIDEAISYVIQAADALQHASERDIVHRDIKPSNLLVMANGRAKLVDMGLARLRQVGGADDLTETGVTLGTFDYISPEQAREPRDTDVRSDLYSLGCTFYYMLTGMPPFPEGTAMQKLLNHSGTVAPDPRDLRGDIPEELSAICLRLMAKDPGQRYQQPNDLIDALTDACELLGLITPQTTRSQRSERNELFDRVGPYLPWAIPVALLFAIVFGVEGLLPQAASVSRDELEPILRKAPVAAESSTNANAKSPGNVATQDVGAPTDPLPEATMTEPETPLTSAVDPPSEVVATEPDAPSLADLPPFEETSASLEVEPTEAVLDLVPESLVSLLNDQGSGVPDPAAIKPSEVGTEEEPIAYDPTRVIVMPGAPPSPNPNPMLVTSLEEAIRRLPLDFPEATEIELRFDRVRSRPLRIESQRNLSIVAAAGYKPVVAFDAEPAGDKRMVNVLGGELTLTGVHLEVDVPDVIEGGWALFHLNEVKQISLVRSSLTIRNDSRADASFFQVQGPRMSDPVADADAVPTATLPFITLDHVIARGQATFVRATDGLPFRLEYTDGFVVTTERLIELEQLAAQDLTVARIELRRVTAMMNEGMCRVQMRGDKSRLPQVRIDTHACLLRHLSTSPLIEHIGVEGLNEVRNMTGLRLSGDENGYPGSRILWRLLSRSGDVLNINWDERDAGWFEQSYNRSAQWAGEVPDETKRPYDVAPSEYAVRGDYIGLLPGLADILPEMMAVKATDDNAAAEDEESD